MGIINKELASRLEDSRRRIDKLKMDLLKKKNDLKVAHRAINQLEKNIERARIRSTTKPYNGINEFLVNKQSELLVLKTGINGLDELERLIEEDRQKLELLIQQRRQYLLDQLLYIETLIEHELDHSIKGQRMKSSQHPSKKANSNLRRK